jgi:hypothetical protein
VDGAHCSALWRVGGVTVSFVFTLTKAGETAPFYTSDPQHFEPSMAFDPEGIATGFVQIINQLEPGVDYIMNVSASNNYGHSPAIAAKQFRTPMPSVPTYSNQRNGFLNSFPAFYIDVHPNGLDTTIEFQMVRAGDSFETPIATSTNFVVGTTASRRVWTSGLPNTAEAGQTYKWRVVAVNAIGTAHSDTLQFSKPN